MWPMCSDSSSVRALSCVVACGRTVGGVDACVMQKALASGADLDKLLVAKTKSKGRGAKEGVKLWEAPGGKDRSKARRQGSQGEAA